MFWNITLSLMTKQNKLECLPKASLSSLFSYLLLRLKKSLLTFVNRSKRKFSSSSPTKRQNKLEDLSLTSLFTLPQHLWVRSGVNPWGEHLKALRYNPALYANIKLGWKNFSGTNSPAYFANPWRNNQSVLNVIGHSFGRSLNTSSTPRRNFSFITSPSGVAF